MDGPCFDVIGYLLGLPLGVLLTITDSGGLSPHPVLYRILDIIVNITRSIPFLILLILIQPFTRAVVGKSYGTTATIVPLAVAAIPEELSSPSPSGRPFNIT